MDLREKIERISGQAETEEKRAAMLLSLIQSEKKEMLEGLRMEEKNTDDEGDMEVAKTRAIMGTAMASGYNQAVSELNEKINKLIEEQNE